jgi:acyl-CoA thioesterase-1
MPFDVFLSPDELHMNDFSYACIARGLGSAITEALTRPVATASRPALKR